MGDSVFYDCYSLADITLPTGLKDMGGGMFYKCSGLLTATFPDGVGMTTVPSATFFECISLKTVNLGDTISATAGTAFYAAGLEYWGDGAGVYGRFTVNCAQPEEYFFRNEFDTCYLNLGESQVINEAGDEIVYLWLSTEINGDGARVYTFKAQSSGGGCGGSGVAGELSVFTMEESCLPAFHYGVENGRPQDIGEIDSTRLQMLQSALPVVLTVNTQTGTNGTPTLYTEYTPSELEALAEDSTTAGYQFVGMKGWAVMAGTEYVTLDHLLGGAGFGAGDRILLTASDGASYSIGYEELQRYNQFFGEGQSLTNKLETGAATVPAILALSWNTGVIEDTDETDRAAVARVAATAYKSTNFRFACGLSWENYKDLDNCEGMDPGIVCSGYRMLQKVESVTVIHPKSGSDSDSGTDPALFTDIEDGAWYSESVDYVVEKGLFHGTSATTFSPDSAMTRSQFAAVIYRLAGSPAVSGTAAFTDVTREQIATFLYRYAQMMGYGLSAEGDLSAYADASAVGVAAVDGMEWSVGNGIIVGKGAETLDPLADASRVEAATMLMRFCTAFAD